MGRSTIIVFGIPLSYLCTTALLRIPRMMAKFSNALCKYIFPLVLVGLSGACQPGPTSTPSIPKNLNPPPLLYIAGNRLFQQQSGEVSQIANLGEEGKVFGAVRIKETVVILRNHGLQRVEIDTGKVEMVVVFERPPLYGELVRTAGDRFLFYTTALESGCSPTGIGARIGLYQVDQSQSRVVYSSDNGYVRPLGFTADQRGYFSLPVGCDPEFDRFWMVSMDSGEIIKELPTWDVTSKEYGRGDAALSPDSHFLAFATTYYVEAENLVKNRFSIYNLDTMTIERYDLPHYPSHSKGVLWSPESQSLYFVLNPGTPYDETPESYGLWSLNIQTGQFLQISDLADPFLHLVSFSADGQWILLQPETSLTVTWVHIPTGEKIQINLPPEGENQIVRE